MILMSIVSLRAEHQLWIAGLPKITQTILDSIPMCRRSPSGMSRTVN